MNLVAISGYVGQFIKTASTPSGLDVLEFSIGVTRKSKSGGAIWQDFSVTAFGKTAQYNNNLTQGTKVVIIGELSERKWKTKEGQKAKRVFIIANQINQCQRSDKKEAETQDVFGDAGIDESAPF